MRKMLIVVIIAFLFWICLLIINSHSSTFNATPLSDASYKTLIEYCDSYRIAPSLVLGVIEVDNNFEKNYNSVEIENLIIKLSDCFENCGNLESGLTIYHYGYDNADSSYVNQVLIAAEKWEEIDKN